MAHSCQSMPRLTGEISLHGVEFEAFINVRCEQHPWSSVAANGSRAVGPTYGLLGGCHSKMPTELLQGNRLDCVVTSPSWRSIGSKCCVG